MDPQTPTNPVPTGPLLEPTPLPSPLKKNLPKIITAAVIALVTVASAGLLYRYRNQNISLTAPQQSSADTTITVSDNFDGTSLNTSKWGTWTNATGTSFSQADGKLIINISQQQSDQKAASVYTRQFFSGDFTAETELSSITTGNSGSIKFFFEKSGTGSMARVSRYKSPTYDRLDTQFGSEGLTSVDLPAGTGSIKVKIARTGSVIQTFYDLGNGYQLLGQTQNGYTGGGPFIHLSVVFGPDFPATTVKFDNFSATGKVVANTEVTDDFSGATLDTSKWQIWKSGGGTANQENEMFRVIIPTGQTAYSDGGIRTLQAVAGDFEAQADLKMESVENKSTADIFLGFFDSGDGENFNTFIAILRKEVNQTRLIGSIHIPNDPQWKETSKTLTDNDTGRVVTVKINRTGSTVSFYYKLPGENDFTLLTSRDNSYTGPGDVRLSTNSRGGFPAVTGTFDNFRLITSVEAVSTPTPTPTAAPGFTPGAPNACGGTCGSNSNCQANYVCYQGFCRNPLCQAESSCLCTITTPVPSPVIIYKTVYPTPKPSPTPTPTIAAYSYPTPTPTPYYASPSIPPLVVEKIEEPLTFWERIAQFFKNLFGSN